MVLFQSNRKCIWHYIYITINKDVYHPAEWNNMLTLRSNAMAKAEGHSNILLFEFSKKRFALSQNEIRLPWVIFYLPRLCPVDSPKSPLMLFYVNIAFTHTHTHKDAHVLDAYTHILFPH